ncbi:dopamine receptor 2 [Xenopus laevis]|uniref:Dopamine receptor 2 n=2 Tax=Xenopus laevis TaxID=8355 RepID=A0A8J0VBX5_XENLA|nr:dopamine receptor 2 [Xenopus laevis]
MFLVFILILFYFFSFPPPGNVLVIIVISATKGFHSMTSAFIINLAVSDCLVGLGVMPFVAFSLLYEDWHNIHELCLFVGYMSSVYCTASVLSVAAVSLDRYWAIVDCLRYDRPWTTRKTLYTITWIWIQALLTCCPPLLGWSQIVYVPSKYTCTTDWTTSTSYTIFFMAVSVLIPAAVLIYCHIRTISVARRHAKKIQILESQLQRNSPRKKVSEIDKPTCSQLIFIVNCKFLTDSNSFDSQSITSFSPDLLNLKNVKRDIFSDNDLYGKDPCGRFRLIFVLVAFLCCWVPYMVVNLIQAIEQATLQHTTMIPSPVITTAYWLTLLNSDFNPLFYVLLSKRFQKALQVFLRRICGRDPLTDIPSFHRRRTSSNVTGISQFHCPTDQHNQGENTGPQPSPVISRHNSQKFNESLPGHLSNSSEPRISSYEADSENRSVLLNPSSLPEQFLRVPNASPSLIRLPSVSGGKRSKLVCGNITIQVSCEEN